MSVISSMSFVSVLLYNVWALQYMSLTKDLEYNTIDSKAEEQRTVVVLQLILKRSSLYLAFPEL